MLSLGQQTWAPVWTQEAPQACNPAPQLNEQALPTQLNPDGQSVLLQHAPCGMQSLPQAEKPAAQVGVPVQACVVVSQTCFPSPLGVWQSESKQHCEPPT